MSYQRKTLANLVERSRNLSVKAWVGFDFVTVKEVKVGQQNSRIKIDQF